MYKTAYAIKILKLILCEWLFGNLLYLADNRSPDWAQGLTPNMGSDVGHDSFVRWNGPVLFIMQGQVVVTPDPSLETSIKE